ncbi:hypothetical protein HPB50_006302 [Hyalomma asiaticum]|uniref:Uncharacterized protein n=1 Tax=Hyalomma asiaticum TaxID=266040 RepID=A0ACB7SC86_HYAAI|nr:hypothetical protein HPB50_006302 [Hyalomma asiaticum]
MDKAAERRTHRAAAARARRSDPAVRAREAEASRDSARRRREDPAVRALTLLTSFIENTKKQGDLLKESAVTSVVAETTSPDCVVNHKRQRGVKDAEYSRSRQQKNRIISYKWYKSTHWVSVTLGRLL